MPTRSLLAAVALLAAPVLASASAFASPNDLTIVTRDDSLQRAVQSAYVQPFTALTGAPVQIVGAMSLLHGRDYLLARLLTVGGRTVTLRSEHGLPVHERIAGAAHSGREHQISKTAPAGSQL